MTNWQKFAVAALLYGLVMGMGRAFLEQWNWGWDAVAYGGQQRART
jgi:hypothetical protein